MVTAAAKQHAHKFEIKSLGNGVTRGTCKCGEIREYSGYGRDAHFKVIKQGDPYYQDEKRQIVVDHTDEIMAELTGSTAKPMENMPKNMPPKPKGTVAVRKWIDENKDAIIADLSTIGERRTREKWGFKPTALRNAKIRWGIYKAKTPAATFIPSEAESSTEKAEKVTPKPETATDTLEDPADALAFESAINIDITWDFLNSLGDEDFNRLWAALGVIVQVQASKRVEAKE